MGLTKNIKKLVHYGIGAKLIQPEDEIFMINQYLDLFGLDEYDNPDIVDFVDGYSLGWWGECHHVILQDQNKFEQVFDWFTTLYSTHFKNVLLTLPFGCLLYTSPSPRDS